MKNWGYNSAHLRTPKLYFFGPRFTWNVVHYETWSTFNETENSGGARLYKRKGKSALISSVKLGRGCYRKIGKQAMPLLCKDVKTGNITVIERWENRGYGCYEKTKYEIYRSGS